MAKNKNALFLTVGRFWEHINGKHKTLQKKHSEGQGFLRTSPTEDNLSPSFWTCFLRKMKHSGRKKHSSLLGVLLAEMPPAPEKTPPVVRNVFEGDETQRKKKALLFVGSAFWRRCPPAPEKTPLVLWGFFSGAESQRKKKALLLVGSAFFWSW